MHQIFDFEWYAANVLKIQTKTSGIRPFRLLQYQREFVADLKEKEKSGVPIRYLVLKARQCGFSTLVGGIFVSKMQTLENFKTILLADKAGRTDEVFSIYQRFVDLTPKIIRPRIATKNNREIHFDNTDINTKLLDPGLDSGLKAETAQDPFAGRSGTRLAAHMSEYGFYPYARQVNEGVQNSIPAAPRTYIIKESTANGMTGRGESFFSEWEAAMRGEVASTPFFVAWYKVDDYAMNPGMGFRKTQYEIDLVKRCPLITDANLAWRRFKLLEYAGTKAAILTPEERFCEDYPSWPEEAFLNSGRPIFPALKVKRHIHDLRDSPPPRINFKIGKETPRPMLTMFQDQLIIWELPKENERYNIGADTAEGLENGDLSTAFVTTESGRQVAAWAGHIDPDLFGRLLVELAKLYNKALITPEINNMGYAVLAAIKNAGYLRVYMREIKDTLSDEEQEKMGWRTTSANKMALLAGLVSAYRDDEILIRDIELLYEMQKVCKESDGDVSLNGLDRLVAAALALEGRKQLYQQATVINPAEKRKEIIHRERSDLSRQKIIKEQKRRRV